MKVRGRPRAKGAQQLRVDLKTATRQIEAALVMLKNAKQSAEEVGATDQLAIATKALRAIANTENATIRRARGIATTALALMEVPRG
jgi:exopolyphosphatase/pppGpp-phosphohydrolase